MWKQEGGEEEVLKVTQTIETRFEASMKTAAEQISREFPNISASVSSFVGGAPPAHVLAIECLFREASHEEADLLALCITTEQINTRPEIHVDITWGDPSGYV